MYNQFIILCVFNISLFQFFFILNSINKNETWYFKYLKNLSESISYTTAHHHTILKKKE